MTSGKPDLDKLPAIDKGLVACTCVLHIIVHPILVGTVAVSVLSEMVSQRNIRERFSTDKEIWPPYQPKIFTPLVLIHHQGHCTRKQATAAQLVQAGDINRIASLASNQSVSKHHPKPNNHNQLQEILDSSTVTKELPEVLAMLEQSHLAFFILLSKNSWLPII